MDQRIGFPEELFHGAVGGAVGGLEAAYADALEGLSSLFVLVKVEEQGGDDPDEAGAHVLSEQNGGAGQGGRCPFHFQAGGEIGSFALEVLPGSGPDCTEGAFSETYIEENGFIGRRIESIQMLVDIDALLAEEHQGHQGTGKNAVTGQGDGLVAAICEGADRGVFVGKDEGAVVVRDTADDGIAMLAGDDKLGSIDGGEVEESFPELVLIVFYGGAGYGTDMDGLEVGVEIFDKQVGGLIVCEGGSTEDEFASVTGSSVCKGWTVVIFVRVVTGGQQDGEYDDSHNHGLII